MPRTIKKYANRRLYDTTASSHVTLEGIRKLLASGEDVEIIDDTNGEDVTRAVLLQVMTDEEQKGRPILSAAMLTQIIRFYGNPMQDFMGKHLEQSMNVFMKQQETMQEQFQNMMSANPFANMQNTGAFNTDMLKEMQQAFLDGLTPGSKKKP